MMQELIICKGLPGSGKSTFAKAWVLEDPKHRVRVNRDDIRRMLGPYWVPTRENLVTLIERDMVKIALLDDFHVVVDATNFREVWQEIANIVTIEYYKTISLRVEDFTHITPEVCIERDKNRPFVEQCGAEVIMRMYNKYIKK